MKTLNFKLSKKLNEAGLLDEIETEYIYDEVKSDGIMGVIEYSKKTITGKSVKTLTLEEAKSVFDLFVDYDDRWKAYECRSNRSDWFNEKGPSYSKYGDTEIMSIEEMLEYLLDNNLLGKQK